MLAKNKIKKIFKSEDGSQYTHSELDQKSQNVAERQLAFKGIRTDHYYNKLALEMKKNAKRGGRFGTREILKETPIEQGSHILVS